MKTDMSNKFYKGKQSDEKPSLRLWTEVVMAISSFLTLLITIVTTKGVVPSWFIYIPIGFFTISVIVLLWIPIATYIREKLQYRRYNQLARHYYPGFRELTQRFSEFVDSRRSDTLNAQLRDLQGHEEVRGKLKLLPLSIIESFFYIFKKKIEGFDKDFGNLSLLAEEFDNIMRFYNGSYVIEPLQMLRQINIDGIPKEKVGEIELFRENYSAFLRDYVNYAKRANEDFGKEIFYEYYEMPKALR